MICFGHRRATSITKCSGRMSQGSWESCYLGNSLLPLIGDAGRTRIYVELSALARVCAVAARRHCLSRDEVDDGSNSTGNTESSANGPTSRECDALLTGRSAKRDEPLRANCLKE